jgi:hypothetical protein
MYAVIAVAVGLVVGLATGGKFSNVVSRPFRSAWLLVPGVGFQAVTEVWHLARTPDELVVLASYVSLALFAVRNLHLAGMGVVGIGLALNIVPIAVNQGMPVRASAIVRSGIVRHSNEIGRLRFGGKRHLEGPDDRLTFLGDVLPDWVFHEVLSFGDLVMAVGIAAVCSNLLRPARRRGPAGTADAQPGEAAVAEGAGAAVALASGSAAGNVPAGIVQVAVEGVEGGFDGRFFDGDRPANAHAVSLRTGQEHGNRPLLADGQADH